MAESARSRLKVRYAVPPLPHPICHPSLPPSPEPDALLTHTQEIGDIQNWAEMIEHELLVMEETMNIVYDEERLLQESAVPEPQPLPLAT